MQSFSMTRPRRRVNNRAASRLGAMRIRGCGRRAAFTVVILRCARLRASKDEPRAQISHPSWLAEDGSYLKDDAGK
jgi:hypothetical protein